MPSTRRSNVLLPPPLWPMTTSRSCGFTPRIDAVEDRVLAETQHDVFHTKEEFGLRVAVTHGLVESWTHAQDEDVDERIKGDDGCNRSDDAGSRRRADARRTALDRQPAGSTPPARRSARRTRS